MGLERYVVDAVVLEGRSPTEIARLHGHLQELAGPTPRALPRGRLCSPRSALPTAAFLLRAELAEAGHDAGPATIATISAAASRQFPRRRRYGASLGATG